MRATAWCRVDLAGGTLDIWPLGVMIPHARTVNVALDLEVTAEIAPAAAGYLVRQGDVAVRADSPAELAAHPEAGLAGQVAAALDLPPLTASLASRSPRGGGLGASSALTVALIAAAEAAFDLPPTLPAAKARLARDLEARLMRLPTGMQDHYAALLGGALEIAQLPGGERVRRLQVSLDVLAASLLVVYSGQSHFSAGQNWQAIRSYLDGDRHTAGLLDGISGAATELGAALEAGDLARVGALMTREWRFRRQLAEGASTPSIERLLDAAGTLGAWGGKACGAGGGGCVALLCPPEKKQAIAERLHQAGGRVLDTRPTGEALRLEAL